MDAGEALDFVVEELDADRGFLEVGRVDFDHIAADAELAAAEVEIIALEKHADD